MSRSYKRAFIIVSKKLKDNTYRILRKRIKSKLTQIDPNDVDGSDLCDIEADTRDLGVEEYGTKIGMEFESLKEDGQYDWNDEESQKKQLKEERRK